MNFLNFKDWLLIEDARLPEEIYKNILDWIKQSALNGRAGVHQNFNLSFNKHPTFKLLHDPKDKYTVNVLFDTNCDGGNAYMNNFKSIKNELGGKNYMAKICISRDTNLTVIKSLLDHELFHFVQQVLADKNNFGGVTKKKLLGRKMRNSLNSITKNGFDEKDLEFLNQDDNEKVVFQKQIKNATNTLENPLEHVPYLQGILHYIEFAYFIEKFKKYFGVDKFYDNYDIFKNTQEFGNFVQTLKNENDKLAFLKYIIEDKEIPKNPLLYDIKIKLRALEDNKNIYKYYIDKILKQFVSNKIKSNFDQEVEFFKTKK